MVLDNRINIFWNEDDKVYIVEVGVICLRCTSVVISQQSTEVYYEGTMIARLAGTDRFNFVLDVPGALS